MELTEAKRLAEELLSEWNLPEWSFEFDSAKARFGQCRYGDQTISLSVHLVQINEEARVRRTILHEIAHALAGPGAGHGPKWRAQCRVVGIDPKARWDYEDTTAPDAPYRRECADKCGNGAPAYRRSKRVVWCGSCYRKLGRKVRLVYTPQPVDSL